ncbi:hypothetical protein FISHEDRAFT_76080 [Fistulina hepatica ATCC 64428]|uniref:Uncharacterized protein n=1 Tax=Fistulina hepatica ATCC 64428 TaxID=1128425 RepID=A0A0D7A7F8_9AGAR|nr:hypothetical protein FISHEDRAFT_76080 [Fistulina hepatica ATCC 64428]
MLCVAFAFVVVLGLCTSALANAGVYQDIAFLQNSHSNLLNYPTSFTQNIVPKMIHSHNDYWRDVPLYTALSYGVSSVEADVWLVNGTLYIGHEESALTVDRTFDSLYIQPLMQIIKGINPNTVFTKDLTGVNGVWDTSSSTALQLLVDVKTSGNETIQPVIDALEPLRELGFLTTYANDTLTTSAVTVVGTGNTPLWAIQALEKRDIFFDAPLAALTNTTVTDDAGGSYTNVSWSTAISPLASTDYGTAVGWDGRSDISETELSKIVKLIDNAHEFGITARFWDTPGWPIYARDNIWKTLLENGADWLNADDLEAASSF